MSKTAPMRQYKKPDPTRAETMTSLRQVIAKYEVRAMEARRQGKESTARMWQETATSLRYCADRDTLIAPAPAHDISGRCLIVRA